MVDALRCAVTVQLAMSGREAAEPEETRIAYRIGINLGDIIIEDDDIYGDGVNVAARLEALAEPGGVCVSRTVVDHVKGKVASDFEDQGEQEVKNIPRADPRLSGADGVRGCRRIGVRGERQGLVVAPRWWGRPRSSPLRSSASCCGNLGHQTWSAPSVERMAFPLPDKPSIAVLPFDNMSSDPEQEHFADGLTEDLITDLSRISGLFVIARNSTFVYKGRSVPVSQVAEDLGVRYVLEGSVRRAGDEVRVNAQLIDATTGGHVWADRYDGSVAVIFSVQDAFIRKIVKALAVNLSEEEQEEIALGQTSSIEAREVFQKGWDSYLRYSADDNAEAVSFFEAALGLDPEYGRAYAAMGMAYLRGCQLRWNKPLKMSVDRANAKASENLYETENRPSSLANVAASQINLYNNRYEEAFTEATRAIAQDPNDPEAYIAMAWAMITTGRPGPGLELVERAMRSIQPIRTIMSWHSAWLTSRWMIFQKQRMFLQRPRA